MSHPRIIIGIPTISRFDLLSRLITSINEQTRKPDLIFVIDNSNGGYKKTQDNIEVFKTNNLGVAGSWNFMMKKFKKDLLIIVNDDNKLIPECIEAFEKLYLKDPKNGFYSGLTGFSLFSLIPEIAIKKIGFFDEKFFPAYYEDSDYHYRMILNNERFVNSHIQLCEIGINSKSSNTVNNPKIKISLKQEIQKGILKNRKRYLKKWGGLPHIEKYKTPFNK